MADDKVSNQVLPTVSPIGAQRRTRVPWDGKIWKVALKVAGFRQGPRVGVNLRGRREGIMLSSRMEKGEIRRLWSELRSSKEGLLAAIKALWGAAPGHWLMSVEEVSGLGSQGGKN